MPIRHANTEPTEGTLTYTEWNASHEITDGSLDVGGSTLYFTDVTLYRSGAGTLKASNNFTVGGYISGDILVPQSLPSTPYSSGLKMLVTAGENMGIGSAVYMRSTGKCWRAKADAETSSPAIGLSTSSITADATGTILLYGNYRYDVWSFNTIGNLVYLSTVTAGGLTTTIPANSGHVVQVVGVASGTNSVLLMPNLGIVTLA